MSKIDQLREQIDRIDDKFLEMLNRRAKLAIKIGQEKARLNRNNHFHVPHREREIFERLKSQNKGPFPDSAIESVFREICSATLALEKPLNIAYLGPETTFSHQAAMKKFGHSAEFRPATHINGIFRLVEQGHADYGVVPIENSIEGVVNLTLDTFVDSPLVICDEIRLGISHCLMSHSGKPGQVKEIHSHPQALAQCRNWLSEHYPDAEQIPTSSTAIAAQLAGQEKHIAAVAGKLAAETYKLKVIAERIEDDLKNTTRFLIIGKEMAKKAKHNKTSIMFSIKDEAGSLLKILQLFARHEINLTKIQSRPLRNRPWEYLFFVDFEGHVEEPGIVKVLDTLRKRSLFLRVMGSYPRKSG
ncbi:MAG: prephenate dehydratase [Nitrospina sp.]|nr:prephenate dehydratase [Nitrospina sp.]